MTLRVLKICAGLWAAGMLLPAAAESSFTEDGTHFAPHKPLACPAIPDTPDKPRCVRVEVKAIGFGERNGFTPLEPVDGDQRQPETRGLNRIVAVDAAGRRIATADATESATMARECPVGQSCYWLRLHSVMVLPAAAVKLIAIRNNTVVAELSASSSRPVARVLTPARGSTWKPGSTNRISWSLGDDDGDEVARWIEVLTPPHQDWKGLWVDRAASTHLDVRANDIRASPNATVRVRYSDGFNTGFAAVPGVNVPPRLKGPRIDVWTPDSYMRTPEKFYCCSFLTFSGRAHDSNSFEPVDVEWISDGVTISRDERFSTTHFAGRRGRQSLYVRAVGRNGIAARKLVQFDLTTLCEDQCPGQPAFRPTAGNSNENSCPPIPVGSASGKSRCLSLVFRSGYFPDPLVEVPGPPSVGDPASGLIAVAHDKDGAELWHKPLPSRYPGVLDSPRGVDAVLLVERSVARITLWDGDRTLATYQRASERGKMTLAPPAGGKLVWATDVRPIWGDNRYGLQYWSRPDPRSEWINNTHYPLFPSNRTQVLVTMSDGFDTAVAIGGPFNVKPRNFKRDEVWIWSPKKSACVDVPVTLDASAEDPNGDDAESSFRWYWRGRLLGKGDRIQTTAFRRAQGRQRVEVKVKGLFGKRYRKSMTFIPKRHCT